MDILFSYIVLNSKTQKDKVHYDITNELTFIN